MKMNKQYFIKGLIAEEIARFHLENMGFSVIHTGKESFDKKLADNSIDISNFKNIENQNTFQLYNQILAKLPDFMIWKKEKEEFEHKFVEIKYRSSLPNIQKSEKGFVYDVALSQDAKEDYLDLKKYFINLDKIFSIMENIKSKWLDLYVYLIVKNDNNKPNIYYGKVWKNKDGFKVDFFNMEYIHNSPYISKNWPNYQQICRFILSNNELFELFEATAMMVRNSDDEIRNIINSKLKL